nr:MAG TPA: hypothetical protein [Caudoviricetes sp.]
MNILSNNFVYSATLVTACSKLVFSPSYRRLI